MKSKPRTFERFPENSICPVCGTNDNSECLLVGVDGTERDNIQEAIPVHLWCAIVTNYSRDAHALYVVGHR